MERIAGESEVGVENCVKILSMCVSGANDVSINGELERIKMYKN